MPRLKKPPKKRKSEIESIKKSFFATKAPFKKNFVGQTQDPYEGNEDLANRDRENIAMIKKAIQKTQPIEKVEKECISRKNFQKIIKDIVHEHNRHLKFHSEALLALHEATEAYMAQFFKDASKLIKGKGRDKKTLKSKQIILLSYMKRIRQIDIEPL